MENLLRRTFAFVIILFIASARLEADTLDIWNWRNPLPNGGPYFNVQFLNGQLIGYGATPGLVTSTDGTNWTARSIPFNGGIGQMAYGNGQYVVVGSAGSSSPIATSPDLQNWTAGNIGMSGTLTSVAFGGGVFVAGPPLFTSTNGTDWFQTSTQSVTDIAYGNGYFVGTLNTVLGQVLVSPDGNAWTPITIATNNFFNSVSFANGLFYAAGYHFMSIFYIPVLYVSADGLSWTSIPDPRGDGNSRFHVLSGNGILTGQILGPPTPPMAPLYITIDGTNFSAVTPNNFSNKTFNAFGNGVFVSGFLQTSVDITNWSTSAISPTNRGYSVQDIFITTNGYAALSTASLLTSSSGLKFSFVTNTVPVQISRVKLANGLYHGVGSGGALARSTNGLDWVTRNSASANSLYDIDYGNSVWAAVGANGTITTSSTGNAWSLQTSGTSISLNGIVYGTNLFAVVGGNGTVLTSSTGASWTPQFSGSTANLNKVAYGNGKFIAVGANGTIVSSSNAVDWFVQTSGVSVDLFDIAFGDGVFCAVGSTALANAVLTSADGITWTSRYLPVTKFAYGSGLSVRYLNGTFFVLTESDILQSGPVRPVQLQLTFNSVKPTVKMQSSTGLLFRLQSAGALSGPWQNLGLFTMPGSGSLEYPDASASSQPQEFYRAMAP